MVREVKIVPVANLMSPSSGTNGALMIVDAGSGGGGGGGGNGEVLAYRTRLALEQLDRVVQNAYANGSIDEVNDAFDNFDAGTMQTITEEEAAPALIVSAIAHASANYWFAQAADDERELTRTGCCGYPTGRRCPIP